jgi:hypothetical protein
MDHREQDSTVVARMNQYYLRILAATAVSPILTLAAPVKPGDARGRCYWCGAHFQGPGATYPDGIVKHENGLWAGNLCRPCTQQRDRQPANER